jgi:hypothetical protein
MRVRWEIGAALALAALGGAGCSDAGLHKADGRGHFVETLNTAQTLCAFSATGKGKRTLELRCDGEATAALEEKAAKICSNAEVVGFQFITFKDAEGERRCEVAQGCACSR